MPDYMMSVRSVINGNFTDGIGDETLFLEIPDGETPSPVQHKIDRDVWYGRVIAAAAWVVPGTTNARGDILFYVHGFNNTEEDIFTRHNQIKNGLAFSNFKGVVVSFDWPCHNIPVAYMADMHDAKVTAFKLVSDGIFELSGRQKASCTVNIHILCHSMGGYLLQKAFEDADEALLPNASWGVSQIIFVAADVDVSTMAADDKDGELIYAHCVRLTNYSNLHDEVLSISNVKRLGFDPRVGRKGLPADAPKIQAVNVDCTAYYEQLTADNSAVAIRDQPTGFTPGVKCHSWYFGNQNFMRDLFDVLIGTDRTVIKTRKTDISGALILQ